MDFSQSVSRKHCREQNLEFFIVDSSLNLPNKEEGLDSAALDRFFNKCNACVERVWFLYTRCPKLFAGKENSYA